MTWKTVANNHFGSSHIFGGNDIDKISKYFGGTEDIDTVDINTNWPIRDDKFKLRNPANTASYIYSTSAIPADRTITEPVMTFSSDKPVYENATQTLQNKTFSNSPFPPDIDVINLPSLVGGADLTKRWGSMMPQSGSTVGTTSVMEGILKGYTPVGSVGVAVWDSPVTFNNDFHVRFGASSGLAGLSTSATTGNVKLAKAGKITALVTDYQGMSPPYRWGVGLTNYATPPSIPTPLLGGGRSGIMTGFSKLIEDNAYDTLVIFHSAAGGGAQSISLNTIDQWYGRAYKYEMSWPDGGTPITVVWHDLTVLDEGTPFTTSISTNLPGPNEELYFQCFIQTAQPGPYHFEVAGLWIELTA